LQLRRGSIKRKIAGTTWHRRSLWKGALGSRKIHKVKKKIIIRARYKKDFCFFKNLSEQHIEKRHPEVFILLDKLDYQPLFGKGARTLPSREGT